MRIFSVIFRYVLAPLAVLLYVCGLASQAHAQAHDFDGTTLVLRGVGQLQVASITYAGGKVDIVIDPAHRYQWAHDEGAGYRAGTRVATDFYEVTHERLTSPAARAGWRNPLRLDRFFFPINQYTGPDLPDGRAFVDVRGSARGDFLIVVTVITKPPKGASP
jgi:hypothetical protein